MKVIRTTILTPREGSAEDVASLLNELGEYLAKEPGFIEAYGFKDDGKLGRVSIWESREYADRAATQTHTIALRAKLFSLTVGRQEQLAEVKSEQHTAAALVA